MSKRHALGLLLSATLLVVGCPKKEDSSGETSAKAKKSGDDAEKKAKAKAKDDDDDDDEKAKKKEKKDKPKKKGDDDDDEPKKKAPKEPNDDDADEPGDAPAPKKGERLVATCDDTAKSIRPEAADEFVVTCPKACTKGPVWGSGPYTTDSHLCAAAVHAGVVTAADGGDVDVTIGAGQTVYKGSVANGVTSSPWGAFAESFGVTAVAPASASGKTPAAPEDDDTHGKKPPPVVEAPALFAGTYSSNWGTTVFTQLGEKVNGKYPQGTLACTVVKEVSLACSWFEAAGSGRAFLTRIASSGVITGTWGNGTSASDGGGWTFTPVKPK